ncbi:hypothetical protein FIBSPDRAFT_847031 [Athelia psychrophila]|uniref:N-acetyltransferase domain-containing protein n=1 Tax=Athelia psychrophila TaxID=1759441 RepID=A0A166WL04_9AGAM|nr:hypothetical protein FIBSPDRAFT_847031 [Fibularhizoctonia sp. CBS 109695]
MFYTGGGRVKFLDLQVKNTTESVNCAEQMVLVVLQGDLVISYAIWERWSKANGYWKGQKTIYPLELDHKRNRFDEFHKLSLVPDTATLADQWRAHSYACHSTIRDHFAGPNAECYYLHRLVTHRDYGALGAGSMLVQWGVDRANMEGVVYGCESTTIGFGFYKRFGMNNVGGGGEWIMRSTLAPAVVLEDVVVGLDLAPTFVVSEVAVADSKVRLIEV